MPPRTVKKDPLRNTRFRITLDGEVVGGFNSIDGIGESHNMVDWRTGDAGTPTLRLPSGITDSKDVTLSRGIDLDGTLYQWYRDNKARSSFSRKDVDVQVGDMSDGGSAFAPVLQHRLLNAQPKEFNIGTYDSQSAEVIVETMILATEGVRHLDGSGNELKSGSEKSRAADTTRFT